MRFDPLAYCFRRRNKIRNCENTDVAGDNDRILTLRIEDNIGNVCDGFRAWRFCDSLLTIKRKRVPSCPMIFISR